VVAEDFLGMARETGIEISDQDGVLAWHGPYGGNVKPKGPLAGRKIGCLVASEFSDFQAYYIASYIGELGGQLEFLLVDWVTWKYSRPAIKEKGVVGLWGVRVDPIPVMGGNKAARSKSARAADPKDYDALIVLGDHCGDIMGTEKEVKDLLTGAHANGAVIGGIGGGIIPLISSGLIRGKKCAGNAQVAFMLQRIARLVNATCVEDQRIITARGSLDTPEFVRALGKAFDPQLTDRRKGVLTGKTMLLIAGWDFEDFEVAVPLLELLYRGARIILGTFRAPLLAGPPLLGLEVVQGNFGMSIPLQEIPAASYRTADLADIKSGEFDALFIPGAFCPWNMIEAGYPLDFLRQAQAQRKVISYMCHGPMAVAASGIVENRRLTGWISCNDAVTIMGGTLVPEWAAAIDGNHVSGKTPQEIPEMLDAITFALLGR
jgi:putative intracellular protease/amidase